MQNKILSHNSDHTLIFKTLNTVYFSTYLPLAGLGMTAIYLELAGNMHLGVDRTDLYELLGGFSLHVPSIIDAGMSGAFSRAILGKISKVTRDYRDVLSSFIAIAAVTGVEIAQARMDHAPIDHLDILFASFGTLLHIMFCLREHHMPAHIRIKQEQFKERILSLLHISSTSTEEQGQG